MICRHCGTEISTKNREKAGSIVCPKCGARYQHKSNAQTVSKKRASATRCASCGEFLKEGAEFCHVCGTPCNQHKRYYNVSVSGQEKQKKPKRKKSVLFVLLIIALITALLFAGEKFINVTKRANRSELQTATSRDGKKIVLYPTDPDHVVEDPATTTSFVDNELILSLDNNVSIEELSIMLQQFGGAIAGVNDYLHTYQILFDSTYSHNELKELAAELNRRISSAKAMPNYILQLGLTDYNPNDSEWITEWGNPGGKSWGPEAIRAPKMWEICRSMKRNPINIGVLDNQFYTDHEDLDFTETWNNNYNLWGEGIQFLKANHGTHVAGTAAATANNGKGVAGLALSENSSNLIHLFGASMNGLNNEIREDVYGMSVDAYEAGLVYLIAMKECKVINLSYGGGLSSPVSADEINIVSHIEDTLLSLIHEGYDFLIVKSSGNDRTDYANYDLFTLFREKEVLDRIITVGAAEQDKNGNIYIAEYSNFGDSVDLIAPGTDIWSTVGNGVLWWVNSGYAKNSGTSMASPHVAGTASAIWCVYPNLTGPQMKQILCESASGEYYYKEGLQYSYPLLDAYRAIQLAAEYSNGAHDEKTQETNDNQDSQINNTVNLNGEWNEAYRQFVMNQEYVGYKEYNKALNKETDIFYQDESESRPISFGLYDMNRDGIPELIVYNGFPGSNGAGHNVFTFNNSHIIYSGTMAKWDSALYYKDSDDYPGFFITDGNMGMHETYYFSLIDDQINREHVLTYDRTNAVWDRNTKSWTGDQKIIRKTSDDVLYNLELNGWEHDFKQFSLAEIRVMGWEAFVNYYFSSKNSCYSAYMDFIISGEYLKSGDIQCGYNPDYVTFSLYDMSGDGEPELLIYNGFNGRDSQANYVFSYNGSNIYWCGNSGAVCYGMLGYPGIITRLTMSGWYLEDQYREKYRDVTYTKYVTVSGGSINSERIGITATPIGSSEQIVLYQTDNLELLSTAMQTGFPLQAMSLNEIKTNGWDAFFALNK